jgi:hypothetical protein
MVSSCLEICPAGVIVWYLGIPFGVDLSPVAMWDWCLERLQHKLLFWQCKDLPFAAKLMVVSRILQASHIYYVSCWLPSRAQFHRLEHILHSYLWAKYGGARGLPMVPWAVCIMPKDEGGLGLIDVATQGNILAAKWVVRCLEGSSPW